MGLATGIGIGIQFSRGGGQSWATTLGALEGKFQYIWQEGSFSGDDLLDVLGSGDVITVTGKDFVTDYIPATSAATFDVPNNATYIADDTDFLWINRNEDSRGVEVSELIGYDFSRTLIKYDNASPHHIRWIGILKAGEALTAAELNTIHTQFELPLFWSGVENVNGFVKANRGLAQIIWTAVSAAALDYSDTYETAVLADGGEIINRKVLESEYQRLIDTGNILSCWYAYHYQCGVKKSLVDYGLGDVDMCYKMYNLSPVAGRFAESVRAYSIVAGVDARGEYTSSGIRFRVTNLDGGVRCGFESPTATILPNNNNRIYVRGIIAPDAAGALIGIGAKGHTDTNGFIGLYNAASYKLQASYYGDGAARNAITTNAIFASGVETIFTVLLNCTAETITITKDGDPFQVIDIGAYDPVYPTGVLPDLVGCARTLGRNVFSGYIKQLEMFAL